MNATEALSRPRSLLDAVALAVLVLGGVATVLWIPIDAPEAYASVLIAALFTFGLSLGGAIFIAVQGAAGACWWHPISRLPLALLRTIPVPTVAMALVLGLGLRALYPWTNPEIVAESAVLSSKAGWLNVPFFLARAIFVLVIWFGFVSAFGRRFEERGRGLRRTSILFLLVLAPTLSVASWDWGMSLEPEWFSTMYGVYVFSGAFVSGVAGTIVLAHLLEGTSFLPGRVSPDLRHDLGKLLFAFSSFWAYIWLSEYLLIWYANLPEEATHFVARQSSGWTFLFLLNPVLCFVVPFVGLMSVRAKRSAETLFHVALVVLAGRWLDTYLLVAPSLGPFRGFPVLALLATAALVAAMFLWGRRRAVPSLERAVSMHSR